MTTDYHTPLGANETISVVDINSRLADLDAGIVTGLSSSPLLTAVLYDKKSTTTDGQALTKLDWTTRELNTEVDPFDLVTLSSNQFTPISGDYIIMAQCVAQIGTIEHRIRLYNQTQSSSVFAGMSCKSYFAYNVIAPLYYIFTANGTDAYTIDHYVGNSASSVTGGTSADDGQDEVYTIVTLIKVA